jgi:RNA polymerase sigma factor (sigma-70 family)
MAFPQTQLTRIQRLASRGTEDDWRGFLKDYWGPICRFSMRFGSRNLDDAEDVASETFEVLWEQRLLARWASNRTAKLRTLLCCVVRNILSHRNRVQASRQQRQRDVAEHQDRLNQASEKEADIFYAAWVEDVVEQAVEALATDYCRNGQADYVRVFYGRVCQDMTIAKVAETLKISTTAVDHYYRHARGRLAEKLEELVRRQIQCYCPPGEANEEFASEWQRMSEHLCASGGLEKAVRRSYELWDPTEAKKHRDAALFKATTHLTSIIRSSNHTTSQDETTY